MVMLTDALVRSWSFRRTHLEQRRICCCGRCRVQQPVRAHEQAELRRQAHALGKSGGAVLRRWAELEQDVIELSVTSVQIRKTSVSPARPCSSSPHPARPCSSSPHPARPCFSSPHHARPCSFSPHPSPPLRFWPAYHAVQLEGLGVALLHLLEQLGQARRRGDREQIWQPCRNERSHKAEMRMRGGKKRAKGRAVVTDQHGSPEG